MTICQCTTALFLLLLVTGCSGSQEYENLKADWITAIKDGKPASEIKTLDERTQRLSHKKQKSLCVDVIHASLDGIGLTMSMSLLDHMTPLQTLQHAAKVRREALAATKALQRRADEAERKFEAETGMTYDEWDRKETEKKAEVERRERQPPIPIGTYYDTDLLSLAVTDVRVGFPEVRSTFGKARKLGEQHLLCTFHVKNNHSRKAIHVRSGSAFREDISMVDDAANLVRRGQVGIVNDLIGAAIDAIPPGEDRTHLEAFSVPLPKTEFLILTVNLSAFSGEGRIRFQIPVEEIEEFQRNVQ